MRSPLRYRRFPEADIIAGDFSIGMLETGRAKLRGLAAERITTRHTGQSTSFGASASREPAQRR